MKSKLTLSIEEEVIKMAKAYARENGRSLSELIENFLKRFQKEANPSILEEPVPEYIRSLKGIIPTDTEPSHKNSLTNAKDERFRRKGLL